MIFCNNVTKWLYLPISAFFHKNIFVLDIGKIVRMAYCFFIYLCKNNE